MAPTIALIAGLAAFSTVNALPFTIPYLDKTGRVEVQGHRGGLSMRTEESLWAFAHALVCNTLAEPSGFTADSISGSWR